MSVNISQDVNRRIVDTAMSELNIGRAMTLDDIARMQTIGDDEQSGGDGSDGNSSNSQSGSSSDCEKADAVKKGGIFSRTAKQVASAAPKRGAAPAPAAPKRGTAASPAVVKAMKTSAPNTASTEPPSGSAAKSSKWKGQLLGVSGKSTATATVLKATDTSVAQVDGRAERLRVTVTKELTPAEEQFEALKQKVKDITDLEDHIGTGKKFREAVKEWVKQARSQSKACGALVKRISATKSKTAFETEIGRLERICQACDCVAVLGDAIQCVDTSHDDIASASRGSEANNVTPNITFHDFDL